MTRRYIESFGAGFEGGIGAFGDKLLFMQSDGGLAPWNKFSGLKAILSGPAGGVVGYSRTCYDGERGSPLIAVDMGGTSTVSDPSWLNLLTFRTSLDLPVNSSMSSKRRPPKVSLRM